jgi:hypothetical protein
LPDHGYSDERYCSDFGFAMEVALRWWRETPVAAVEENKPHAGPDSDGRT